MQQHIWFVLLIYGRNEKRKQSNIKYLKTFEKELQEVIADIKEMGKKDKKRRKRESLRQANKDYLLVLSFLFFVSCFPFSQYLICYKLSYMQSKKDRRYKIKRETKERTHTHTEAHTKN